MKVDVVVEFVENDEYVECYVSNKNDKTKRVLIATMRSTIFDDYPDIFQVWSGLLFRAVAGGLRDGGVKLSLSCTTGDGGRP